MNLLRVITFYFVICSLTVALFGCSSEDEVAKNKPVDEEDLFANSKVMDDSITFDANAAFGDEKKMSMSFATKPKSPKLNQSTTLAVKVTSEKAAITDAEVVFEIWREGENQPIQVETKSDQKGTYYLAGKFSEVGTYNLISHVSALNQHEMQTFQFTIQ